jgi:hypothetical protein
MLIYTYCAVLCVDRLATAKEIRAAYLSLASCLHPDKADLSSVESLARHIAQDNVAAAGANTAVNLSSLRELRAISEEHFRLIDRAFRVLSDPVKRQTYDQLGCAAVEALEAAAATPAGKVLSTLRTPSAVRELMARMVREERQSALEGRIGASGQFVVETAVRPLHDADGNLQLQRLLPDVTQLLMQQNVVCALSEHTAGTFGGYVLSRAGVGLGTAVFMLHHKASPLLTVSAGANLGNGQQVSLGAGSTLEAGTSVGGELTYSEEGIGLKMTNGRKLSSRSHLHNTASVGSAGGKLQLRLTQITGATGRGAVIGNTISIRYTRAY